MSLSRIQVASMKVLCAVACFSPWSHHGQSSPLGNESRASLAWAPCCPVPGVLFTAAASLSLRNPKLCAGTRSDADEIAQNRKVNTFCQLPLYIHRENNNRNVLKHKRIFYSNCSKKKNASQTASSLRHQPAWLTAF